MIVETVKQVATPIWTTSDGTEFTSKHLAEKHELLSLAEYVYIAIDYGRGGRDADILAISRTEDRAKEVAASCTYKRNLDVHKVPMDIVLDRGMPY